MANFAHTADIVNYVLFRAGEPVDGTSDFATSIVDHVNRVYQALWLGGGELDSSIDEKWWWLATYNSVILLPALSTGTITVSNNSAAISSTGNLASSVQGEWFKADNHSDVFRITAHATTATAMTLDSVYTGTSDTGAAYKIFKTDYSLATDVLYLSSPMRVYRDGRHDIKGMDNSLMLQKWPRERIESGVPHNFSHIGERQVRFSHYGGVTSGDLIRVEYDYIKEPSALTNATTSIPATPQYYRRIIADWALAHLYEEKNDDRAGAAAGRAAAALKTMAAENRRKKGRQAGGRFSKIVTRQEKENFFITPLRTESGRLLG